MLDWALCNILTTSRRSWYLSRLDFVKNVMDVNLQSELYLRIIFSRKVFCGATRPLRPPGILTSRPGFARGTFPLPPVRSEKSWASLLGQFQKCRRSRQAPLGTHCYSNAGLALEPLSRPHSTRLVLIPRSFARHTIFFWSIFRAGSRQTWLPFWIA